MHAIPKKWLIFIKNFRFPQIVYHSGLLFVGSGLAVTYAHPSWQPSWLMLVPFTLTWLAVTTAWLASVVVNDINDQTIDRITHPDRPLPSQFFSVSEYQNIGWLLFFASLILAALAHPNVALLIFMYQVIAYLYSAKPIRLKRFTYVSTFVSALASLMVVLSGYVLFSDNHALQHFPIGIGILLIIGYTFSLPIKDFKDIPGDRADHVHTVPVVFGEAWGKALVGSGFFISYLLSVAILNEFQLFWWAIICGSLSFFLIQKMNSHLEGGWIHYRNAFWWLLTIVTIYFAVIICLTVLP